MVRIQTENSLFIVFLFVDFSFMLVFIRRYKIVKTKRHVSQGHFYNTALGIISYFCFHFEFVFTLVKVYIYPTEST